MATNPSIHMKTALKAISLLLAVGFTGALFAEFAGVSLPTALDLENMFNAFVIVLTILTTVSDYARENKTVALASPCPAPSVSIATFQRDHTPSRLAA
jgi:hypothetical protein